MNHSVDIDLPVRTVYNQWTQFEDFPLFMRNVKDLRQIDDTHVEWHVSISGVSRTFVTEITEQTPDQRIAWTTLEGPHQSGVVTFHALSDSTTRVMLQMEMEPEGFVEKVADWGGYVSDRTGKDLDQFKDFIENRGRATGEWRGTVERDSMRELHNREDELIDLTDSELASRAEAVGIDHPMDRERDWLVSAVAYKESDTTAH